MQKNEKYPDDSAQGQNREFAAQGTPDMASGYMGEKKVRKEDKPRKERSR